MHTLEKLLLKLSLGDLNLDSLVDLLLVSTLVVGIVLDGGGEEGVDEGGLAQARLAGNLRISSQHYTNQKSIDTILRALGMDSANIP